MTTEGIRRGLYGIVSPGPVDGPEGAAGPARLERLLALGRALLEAGAPTLQLRDKHADGRSLLAAAKALRELTREHGAAFIVNDRADVALMADADGVHVGQDDLPVADVRRLVAATGRTRPFLVGLSTHDLDQVRAALAAGADYLGFGPIYETRSKADALPPRGVTLLAEAVRLAGAVPLVAIGGISRANVAEVAATGVTCAAVIGDVEAAADPLEAARTLHRTLLDDGLRAVV